MRARMVSLVRLFCNPVDCSPPGSSVHGISQARILGWKVGGISQARIPPLRDLPNPGFKPGSLVSSVLAGGFFTTEPPGNALSLVYMEL